LDAVVGGKDPQRFLHGHESGHPIDDEGYMMKLRRREHQKNGHGNL